MKEPTNGLRMIEFFSGIGGMRLAVEGALQESSNDTLLPLSCQAYDISLYANRTYKNNFAGDLVSTKLVEQLKVTDLDGRADLWTMSPPCQPFTMTRGAKGLDIDDKRCHGLKGIMALLTAMEQKPQWILLENVKGFANSRMCQAWMDCLQNNGYSWQEYLLSPVQLGIPNHRLRYYMLCERHSTRWSVPQHDPRESTILVEPPAIDKVATVHPRVVGDYINPSLSENELEPYIVADSILSKDWAKELGVVAIGDTATHCFTAGYGRIFSKATGSLLLFRGPHLRNKDQGGILSDSQSVVIDPTKETAIANSPIDRSDMLRYSGQLRRFSPKELLTLFGFPKSFSFPSDISMDHQYKLVGNSINVTLVTLLVKTLLMASQATTPDDEEQAAPATNQQEHSEETMMIGGQKGHIQESIGGNLLRLYQKFRWKPLPHCTGRYTCRDHKLVSHKPPLEVLAEAGIYSLSKKPFSLDIEQEIPLQVHSFHLPGRPDAVLVVPLDASNLTGLITFEKQENEKSISYVHTLNSPSGFRRKLNAIGIFQFD